MTTMSRLDTPVLRLIGWLLLLLGLAGVEQATMALWQAAAYWSNPAVQMMLGTSASPMEFLLTNGLFGLFSLALLVVGLALLRRVRWARWAAVVALLVKIAWSALYPLVRAFVFWYPIYAAHQPELRQGLWGMLLGLLGALPHLVMILFLVPPRADDAAGRGNVLQRAACAVQGHFARLLPAVVAFVALYLLAQAFVSIYDARWAVQHLAALQHPFADRGIETAIILHTLLVPLVSIIAALCLLWRTRGALGLALMAFGLQAVGLALYTVIFACNSRIWPVNSYNGPRMFSLLAGLAAIGVQAAYLLRARREVPADG